MSELKGHAFCQVSKCEHCESGRCRIHSLKDFEDFTVSEECGDFKRVPLKHVCMDLNEEDVTALLSLLEPSSDEGDPGEYLYDKIYKAYHSNPIASNMFFVNVYNREQIYGGPEEGGWWYHTMQCGYSFGYDCVNWDKIGVPDYSYLIDSFLEHVQNELEDVELPEKEVIIDALKKNGCFELSKLDKYDSGSVVAIERAPGAQHNIDRQHYC